MKDTDITKQIDLVLQDNDGSQNSKEVVVSFNSKGIEIHPKGIAGSACGGAPIYIEYYEGKFRVITWTDPKLEDPTNIIVFPEN